MPKRVKNKAVRVAQLGQSYPQGGDKLNKKRLANKKSQEINNKIKLKENEIFVEKIKPKKNI